MKGFIKAGVLALMAVLAHPGSHAGPTGGFGGDPDGQPPDGGDGTQEITYYLTGPMTVQGVSNKTYATLSKKLGISEEGKKVNGESPALPASFKTDANGFYKFDALWIAGPFKGTVGSTPTHAFDFRIIVKDPSLLGTKSEGSAFYTYPDIKLEAGKTYYAVGGQELIVLQPAGGNSH